MALGTDYARQDCSLARALEVVGERWTLLILRDCFFGVRRFTDFAAHLDISQAVLTERLALVEAGLLRTGGGHAAVRVTERGAASGRRLFAMTQWGEAERAPTGRAGSSSTRPVAPPVRRRRTLRRVRHGPGRRR